MSLIRAITVLNEGGLVAFPTETVYGLGADASNPDAVRRIFQAKGRPPGRALTVHLGRTGQPHQWAHWTPVAEALAQRWWPGPLTLVLPRRDVDDVVTGGLETVGLRVPDHPMALDLLDGFGGGLAAPSANRSGGLSPTTAEHVRADLGDRVDLILDGGACPLGVESTVLSLAGPPTVLRLGAITAEQLAAVLGIEPAIANRSRPTVRTPLRAKSPEEIVADWRIGQGVGVLWRGALPQGARPGWIALPDDPAAYGSRLFGALRALDAAGHRALWVAEIPLEPEWAAIRQKLHD
jgi:L-threonylcarbamoyladenylate synthase